MTTQYLTKQQFATAKSRLTRAQNTGNPQKVIEAVEQQFNEWDAGDYAYPDDWHRWERAKMDAEMALAYGTPYRP
jgi:hypothetical protein